ncbi:PREDICTED: pyridine nucleotide-disulfide oxidoreductase domain-containing protein 2 isoform X1 [Cyprinodon variegatus]|uniref:Pyridine nucleotide-disulfide oxidoreductase domain-containing protein 2 n=1 Tax=Cyprinodon variegatus TaxID=28743 RepID=A0A3Q2CYE7_CYPVA|nr:PREDICTED: pyridine nucleotide-disulfide oxidoreductase domain-containing protein 2 isoform X1 [Cyprinodon variegatus]
MAAAVWTNRGRRLQALLLRGSRSNHSALKTNYDALIIGGGHNGLVAAAYLQKGGVKTAVLERRHVLGGAAVSEEIFPGFHFSRCSYLLSLLRPHIYRDLELKKHGLNVFMRDPHSYTPMLEEGVKGAPPRSLILGSDLAKNQDEIGKFSQKDAKNYPEFAAYLEKLASAIHPLLDAPPVDIRGITAGSPRKRLTAAKTLLPFLKCGLKLGGNIPDLYQIITAPIMKILTQWFDSEPLRATLATDGVIGAMTSPSNPGSGYVLLHHVMGELEKEKGAWGYVEGGMGGVSRAIAKAAQSYGVDIFTEKDVGWILIDSEGAAKGVSLKDGTEIHSKVVLSNATPYITFKSLTPKEALSEEFMKAVDQIDYTSPVTKINVAVDKLPNFLASPTPHNKPGPHHQCSIHLNCEHVAVLEAAYKEAMNGRPSTRPMLEMTIPSVLDPTLAPPGCHVVSLFTQFTPYHIEGREWTEQDREAFADTVFDWVEQYAPGFKSSVVGRDILSPPDLERIFGLTGGNIFHGSMSLDQLYLARPLPSLSDYRSPVKGLYLCGSGCHPGGGVMGSSGWNAALTVLSDLKHHRNI